MTVGQVLQRVTNILSRAGLAEPRRDAELLLSRAMDQPRSYLFAHPEAAFPADRLGALARDTARRRRHYPLQYLLGAQEFYGRPFAVSPAVLIPRPETEVVVDQALEALGRMAGPRLRGLDLGTGSGCIAVTLALEQPRLGMIGVDLSQAALRVAAGNARRLGAGRRVRFFRGDLTEGLSPRARFHLLVSNPPYVSPALREEVDYSVRAYEPAEAVFAPPDGLAVYRRLLAGGARLLLPGGRLVLELGYDVQDAVLELGAAHGWAVRGSRRDLAGIVRCLEFSRPEG